MRERGKERIMQTNYILHTSLRHVPFVWGAYICMYVFRIHINQFWRKSIEPPEKIHSRAEGGKRKAIDTQTSDSEWLYAMPWPYTVDGDGAQNNDSKLKQLLLNNESHLRMTIRKCVRSFKLIRFCVQIVSVPAKCEYMGNINSIRSERTNERTSYLSHMKAIHDS